MSPAQTPLIPVTATLVERALQLRRQDLPADVVTLTHQCLNDVLAVSIAGHRDELPRRLLADLQDQGVGKSEATLLGSGERLGARQAALVNGCAAHALDFDDVNLSINGHPSAVLAPALLALAETLDSSGADLFMAFVAAYEFTCRAGVMVGPVTMRAVITPRGRSACSGPQWVVPACWGWTRCAPATLWALQPPRLPA